MKRSAFTIVELLVGISIFAFLSGITLPVLSGAVQRAKVTHDLSNLRQIGMALQAYQNDHDGNMPPDHGGYFVVSSQSADQTLLNYTGSNFDVWHSKFDPRPLTPGDSSPVSYSINEHVLAPTDLGQVFNGWTGNLAMSEVPLSQLLIASPSVRTDGGAVSWEENVASMVYPLSNQTQEMFDGSTAAPPSFYKRIPVLFADGHAELIPIENYQWTAADPTAWVRWEPMGPSLSPLPLIAWETDTDTGAAETKATAAVTPDTSAGSAAMTVQAPSRMSGSTRTDIKLAPSGTTRTRLPAVSSW